MTNPLSDVLPIASEVGSDGHLAQLCEIRWVFGPLLFVQSDHRDMCSVHYLHAYYFRRRDDRGSDIHFADVIAGTTATGLLSILIERPRQRFASGR